MVSNWFDGLDSVGCTVSKLFRKWRGKKKRNNVIPFCLREVENVVRNYDIVL